MVRSRFMKAVIRAKSRFGSASLRRRRPGTDSWAITSRGANVATGVELERLSVPDVERTRLAAAIGQTRTLRRDRLAGPFHEAIIRIGK